MSPALKNIVVIGGSYVGLGVARELMKTVPATYRVLVVEPKSHFNHIFTFPRFAVLPGHEQKAFIPYDGVFNGSQHQLIKARVVKITRDHVELDKPWSNSTSLPFEYLVLAMGSQLNAPSMMPFDDRVPAVTCLQGYQRRLQAAKRVAIVGGGAVGVQMALDLKELYPDKDVTVIHSRDRVMQQFHEGLHKIVSEQFNKIGVRLITGRRVQVPPGGFEEDPKHPSTLTLDNGETLSTDLVILGTGQKPNNQIVKALPTTLPGGLINPQNGFVRVSPNLRIADESYPNIFAVGDIADTGSHKAARPGSVQAGIVARNILALINGQQPVEEYAATPPGIHLSLGLKRNVIFRNPNPSQGILEPVVTDKEDGRDDLGAIGFWGRMNVQYKEAQEQRM